MNFRIESVSGHNGLHFNRTTQKHEKGELTSVLAVPTEKGTPIESLRLDTLDADFAEQLAHGAEIEVTVKVAGKTEQSADSGQ